MRRRAIIAAVPGLTLVAALGLGVTLAVAPPLAAAPRSKPPLETNPRTGMATPPFEQLVRAVKQRDRAAMARLAGRLGAGRLGQGLAQPDRGVVLAVLTVVPAVRGAVLLVEPVADLTSSLDAGVAAAAARTLGQLLDGDQPADVEQWDVPTDVVARGCAALRDLALRASAPAAARLAALGGLGDAAFFCPDTDGLVPALRDPEPMVRRAAAQVLRARTQGAVDALHAAARDPVPGVATAAMAALCRARDAQSAVLAPTTAEAARALVQRPGASADDTVDMLSCLAASATPADVKILDQLRRGSPSPVRDRAGELAAILAAPKAP